MSVGEEGLRVGQGKGGEGDGGVMLAGGGDGGKEGKGGATKGRGGGQGKEGEEDDGGRGEG